MIPAVALYLLAFGLAWTPVISRGFPWTMLLLACLAVWVAGVVHRLPGALAVGFYGVAALAVWTALSGAFYLGLGAIVLAVVAWDAAGLSLWLRQATEIRDAVGMWQGLLLRSCGLASAGAALALGFARLQLSLPFWAMVVLLLAAWGALAAFRWWVAHPRRSDGHNGGLGGTRFTQ